MSVNLPEPFHPAIRGWFDAQFGAPTACQSRAWATIATGANTLIAAPTGSGKTLAAFLCAIDRLVRASEHGDLPNETRVLYVSPLKALGNDIQRNLEQPLDDIAARMVASGAPDPGIATAVRTGDTPAAARQAMLRRAPHILVTTPESLYILLTSDGGRGLLERIETVIVDEIHAVAGDKRGAHLALSLERLDALVGQPVQRIGLSATQRPIERIAAFLTGRSSHACHIVDEGHHRGRDLGLEVTATPLAAVMANEAWEEIYDRLAALIDAHQTTLIFVNTRRLAERVSRHLVTRLNEEQVAAHHGSMSKEKRLRAEQRLKGGELRALVATASLELGIDIGDVDLVCQLGSTHRISTFLQRVGRAGHGVGRTPKGRLFPLSRDDLVECSALIKAATDGMLDALHVPRGAVDVLAQHVVAECCAGPQAEDQLYERFANAYPYQGLDRTTFDQVLRMLAEGYATRRGQQGAYLHRDAVNGMVEARPNARLVALSAGGAIPETADYAVVAEPEGLAVGTLDEDFAIESIPGDIFQLGNTSWQILRVETNTVRVADAQGAPPTIPFWLGEAPSRTDELSEMVNAIRERIGNADPSPEPTGWDTLYADTATELGIPIEAARQLVDYLLAGARSLGCMPTQRTPILERFFDQSGGMQLVIHAPYGARINRAWGLALRKRFCKSFNFELQAAATEDNIVLSLGETHSFSLSDVEHYLSPNSVVDVLKQALIDAPMFTARWRWNTNVSLAVPRMRAGKKVPPPIQRMQAEDLISVVFPDSIACAENLTGKRDIPDHPLVTQTFEDALHRGMDVDGLVELLTDLANGKTTMHCVDAIEPSPFAAEIIAARPYAYLDDAPLEERRTRAVSPPRDIDPHSAKQLSQISTEAVRRVRAEIWPSLVTPNDVHDALVTGGFLTSPELSGAQSSLNTLRDQRRADEINVTEHAPSIWVAAERINLFSAIHPGLRARVLPPRGYDEALEPTQALERLVRSRLQLVGPTTASMLAKPLGLAPTQVLQTLTKLQAEGFVFAGRFDASVPTDEQQWCERRLLARMHRYAMAERRRSVRPVTASLFMRFLFRWHGFDGPIPTGDQRLFDVLQQLEAFGAPAGNWETDLLNRRVPHYEPGGLDALCLSGRIGWLRLRATDAHGGGGLLNATPIGFSARRRLRDWRTIADDVELSSDAATLRAALEDGPVFLSDLLDDTGLLPAQIERGLSELARHGLATSDSFSGLRALLPRKSGRPRMSARAARRRSSDELEAAGRWSLVTRPGTPREDHVEYAATVLLRRYGIVFRALLDREAAMPAWSELRTAFRQMESAGEVRGGRFVSGFAGEQFASAEAIKVLNALKRQTPTGRRIGISAADPLNLIGIILPGEKVPSSSKATLWFQDGLPREDGNSNRNTGSVGVGPQTVGRPRFAGFVRSRTT